MVEKKQTSDWYIAATHFLTAGFVVPLLAGTAFGIVSVLIAGMDQYGNPVNPQLQIPIALASGVVGALSVWGGVVYSARHVLRTYEMPRPAHVVVLSTIHFVIVAFFYDIALSRLPSPSASGNSVMTMINLTEWLVDTLVFFFASRKYLGA